MWPVLFLLFFPQQAWTQSCNLYFGPSGTTACIRVPSYNNQYQWATCLTDSYILQKSFQRHTCVNPFAIYCWYQCMLEVHQKESGPVTSDCSCSPSSLPSPLLSPITSLPSFCYSPSGTSCQWYGSCLERKYPCRRTANADPLRYAEEICWLYNKRKGIFSSDGRKWVDGVRKCLQVELVPLLRPWNKPTCQEIGKTAFESQVSCYMKPDEGVPSICDLDCKEYFKIFWVIKGYVFNVETNGESLSGLWNIDDKCGSNSSRNCFEEGEQALIKITKLTFQKFNRRGKRSTPDETSQRKFADGVASAIARELKWNTFFMDWFAYPSEAKNASDPTSLEMVMVLADKIALGVVISSSQSVNLSQSLQQLSSAIEGGTLPLQVGEYNVWVKSLASCTDKSCNDTQTLANSDKPPVWPVPTTSHVSDDGGPVTGEIFITRKPSEILSTRKPSEILITRKPGEILITRKPGEILITRKPGEILIIRKPGKFNGGVRISPWNVGMYGITAFVMMLTNQLFF